MDLRGPESVTFRLPDFQQIRGVSRMLGICTRLAIAEGRYDDAIEHIRMNYRVGHDVGKEMFVVCNLIGIAMEGIAEVGVIVTFPQYQSSLCETIGVHGTAVLLE
jgi:hypothetical protein